MHSADIYQKDVHLDNFLDNGNELYLIDGDQLILEKGSNGLSEKRVIENLAMFFTQLFQWEHEYIEAFITSYVALRKKPFPANFLSSITQQLADYKQWREKKYIEKKVFRSCSAFDVIKNWRVFSVFSRKLDRGFVEQLIDDIDSFVGRGEVLKSGRTSTVVKIRVGGEFFILKRYNRKGYLHQLVRCFMESKAAVSWRNGHLLHFNGISTAAALLFLEERCGPMRGRSYLLTEYIDGVRGCDYFEIADTSKQQAMAIKVRALVENLHRSCFSHGDLKSHNILINKVGPVLIDIDGLKRLKTANDKGVRDDWLRLYRDLGNSSVAEILFNKKDL